MENKDVESEQSIELSDKEVNKKVSLLQRLYPVGFKYEFMNVIRVSVPVILTNMLQFVIPIESLIMCGHLTALELEGVALANSMINAFGLSIGTGLCTACDTLFAQAYGSSNKFRTGMFLQRSIMIISLAPLLLWCLHLNMEPIFIYLGQHPDVAQLAAKYMRLFLPGLLFHFNYLILARYMQNQDYVWPPMVIGMIGNIFNIVAQYIFLFVLHNRSEASALCQVATFFIMWSFEVIYILKTKLYQKTWNGWTFEAFYDWGHFLKLAIAGVAHVALEAISWEVCIFLAGVIGQVELAAQSIVSQTEVFTYMLPLGLGVGLNIRVGQYLGANNPDGARTSLNVGLTIITVTITLMVAMFLSCSKVLPYIFTTDPEVVKLTGEIFPFMAIVVLADNVAGVCGGVLRGCGRQKIGAFMIILGYYLLGLPPGIMLAFLTDIKLYGLWTGLSIGIFASTFGYVIVLWKQDWKEQAEIAQNRLAEAPPSEDDSLAKSELTPLLPGNNQIPRKQSLMSNHTPQNSISHRRTPSQPYTCSTEYVPMPPVRGRRSRRVMWLVLRKKIIGVFVLLVIFFSFLALYICLPRQWYLPPVSPTSSYNITDIITDYN